MTFCFNEIRTRYFTNTGARRGAVGKALRYKPEGRGFDFRWCYPMALASTQLLTEISTSNISWGVKAAGA